MLVVARWRAAKQVAGCRPLQKVASKQAGRQALAYVLCHGSHTLGEYVLFARLEYVHAWRSCHIVAAWENIWYRGKSCSTCSVMRSSCPPLPSAHLTLPSRAAPKIQSKDVWYGVRTEYRARSALGTYPATQSSYRLVKLISFLPSLHMHTTADPNPKSSHWFYFLEKKTWMNVVGSSYQPWRNFLLLGNGIFWIQAIMSIQMLEQKASCAESKLEETLHFECISNKVQILIQISAWLQTDRRPHVWWQVTRCLFPHLIFPNRSSTDRFWCYIRLFFVARPAFPAIVGASSHVISRPSSALFYLDALHWIFRSSQSSETQCKGRLNLIVSVKIFSHLEGIKLSWNYYCRELFIAHVSSGICI